MGRSGGLRRCSLRLRRTFENCHTVPPQNGEASKTLSIRETTIHNLHLDLLRSHGSNGTWSFPNLRSSDRHD
ncbi:hypothetical protein BVC80_1317g14 [Macleaya cordata]|uniref:Uncharacterized protein n=1 Tax=Macleaya cordata TaxID=56857 RepID=A0A200QZ44_MACCD|nr:hypothetical protein BVC80_1317g14 [Macleaya cordata]